MSFLRPLAYPSLAAAVAVASVALPPVAAQAHARLVRATPAAKSTVASPRTVTLTFSERVAPAFSSFDVVNAAGTKAPPAHCCSACPPSCSTAHERSGR